MLAQLAWMVGLWLLFAALVVWAMLNEGAQSELNRHFDLILGVVDTLFDDPDRLRRTMPHIDRFLSSDNAVPDQPGARINAIVFDRTHVVFASPGIDSSLRNKRLGVMEELDAQGQHWSAITRQATRSDLRVMLLAPSASGVWMTLTLKGFLIMPLVVSLPLLVLPAWLSVRLALRPWRALSEELSTRGPHDLQPLTFQPVHRELHPLVDNLNGLLRRMRESVTRERQFVADAAHELRTPLAAVRVNVEALQAHGSSPAQPELLDGIVRSVSRATRLVGQLLALMRNEAIAEATTVVTLDELAGERLAVLSALARSAGVELELCANDAVLVRGWSESLVSLIDNLVENAIKHSPAGGIVLVSVASVNGCAVLSVADAGPGIPPHLFDRVFDRFFRLPGQTHPGSGLGLAIVKSAVQRHGGTITLGTAPAGCGLLVEIRLPLWTQPIKPSVA